MTSSEGLAAAVTSSVAPDVAFDAQVLHLALHADARPAPVRAANNLSDRETQVLGLLAAGRSTEAIATQLFLSQHTIRNHVRNLTAKLGAHSRLDAVRIATRKGLVTLVGDTGEAWPQDS